ncbi:RDD family protein [Foetidibacter luteolus]|uniref:RDD family protein n=1 Tax=Foetidibacter luteolus TaxID=2608880 RepID=UPI00129B96CB|nr:RDD family protein [Foetidibacter luteolus]
MKTVGIGTRVLNFLVDTLLVFVLGYFVHKINAFYYFYYKSFYWPFYVWFYIMLVLYYIIFESIFKRTPGKWLSYSKVVNRQGGKPTFLQVIIRSLIRLTIIDCFFFPFLDKTLHDYLSKTEVVEV